MTNRLGNNKFEALLHFCGTHPVTLNQHRQGEVHITLCNLAYSVCAWRIEFIDQAEHTEQIRLDRTFFTQRHDLALAQADRKGFWPRMSKKRPGFPTQCDHFKDRLET